MSVPDSARNKADGVLALQELKSREKDKNLMGKPIIAGYHGGKVHGEARIGYEDLRVLEITFLRK